MNVSRQDLNDSSNIRLWSHDNLWRIQDHRQLPDRNGVSHDVWESRRDENGQVMFFETEDQARAYMQDDKVESENKS